MAQRMDLNTSLGLQARRKDSHLIADSLRQKIGVRLVKARQIAGSYANLTQYRKRFVGLKDQFVDVVDTFRLRDARLPGQSATGAE